MHVKLILPRLKEANSPEWRPLKYSLFPPLGLATLASYITDPHTVEIVDEHVEELTLDDTPELVGIEVYATSANRSYRIADHYRRRGVRVVLGGLHTTALPDEALQHADTVILGPAEEAWPRYLQDLLRGTPERLYRSTTRTLGGMPQPRRDLIKRERYLTPNSLVVSRGCPHNCEFCYKHSFYDGGASFYTQRVDDALEQIQQLPGRHLFFLDDHLFGAPAFAKQLFTEMRRMNRVFQGAATVASILQPGLLESAAEAGLRSLFIGFESINPASLREHHKYQNTVADYHRAVRRLRECGVMANASFVFGADAEDTDVFDATVDWALEMGLETATFHILTPYPGSAIYQQMKQQGRILTDDWDMYDTRHCVYQPLHMTPSQLEEGYWRSYRRFYSLSSIWKSCLTRNSLPGRIQHLAYAVGWKRSEWFWTAVIRAGLLPHFQGLLENTLDLGHKRHPLATTAADTASG